MRCLITFLMLTLVSSLFAQSEITLNAGEGSRIWLEGTSTLHDWSCEAEAFTAVLTSPGENSAAVLTNIAFDIDVVIPVRSIKSSKGDRMDKKMYETLKEEEYSDIHYNLSAVRKSNSSMGDKLIFDTEGTLSIAGSMQLIAIQVVGVLQENDQILFSGSVPLDMTAFGVKPPKMMLGTLRTNKNIVVHFELNMTVAETK
ncbi:MAG: YceI family protein [Calditrichia bacterium]